MKKLDPKRDEMYGVRLLKKKITIDLMGMDVELDLSWAGGMCGAMPVFDNYDDALKYADGDESRIFVLKFG